jgi:hypothetical protein
LGLEAGSSPTGCPKARSIAPIVVGDVVTAALPEHTLFVSQRAWEILTEKSWRYRELGILATPTMLDRTAEPLL